MSFQTVKSVVLLVQRYASTASSTNRFIYDKLRPSPLETHIRVTTLLYSESLKVYPPLYTDRRKMNTDKLEPGQRVKTRGNDIVEVFSVRHFNDTVSIGQTRKYPILVGADEIVEIVEE